VPPITEQFRAAVRPGRIETLRPKRLSSGSVTVSETGDADEGGRPSMVAEIQDPTRNYADGRSEAKVSNLGAETLRASV